MEAINEAMVKKVIYVSVAHKILDQMYKEVAEGNRRPRTHMQKIHNAKTNVQLLNKGLEDYVNICTHPKRKH